MEIKVKARNFAHAYKMFKDDFTAFTEILMSLFFLTSFTMLSCRLFGVWDTFLILLSIGAYLLVFSLVLYLMFILLSFFSSLFSSTVGALFGNIHSVVMKSVADIVGVLTANWGVALGSSLAIIAGYFITQKLYDYFNVPTPIKPEPTTSEEGPSTNSKAS